jgi:hypothetical protein
MRSKDEEDVYFVRKRNLDCLLERKVNSEVEFEDRLSVEEIVQFDK